MSGSDCSSRKVPDENVLRGLGDTAGAADVAAAGVHAHKTTARLRIPTPPVGAPTFLKRQRNITTTNDTINDFNEERLTITTRNDLSRTTMSNTRNDTDGTCSGAAREQ